MFDLDVAIGEATGASLLLQAVITRFVMRGILQKDEAVMLVDAVLLLLEKHRQDIDGPGTRAVDHARSRLESLMRDVQAIRLP
jgi:hypothetical protein